MGARSNIGYYSIFRMGCCLCDSFIKYRSLEEFGDDKKYICDSCKVRMKKQKLEKILQN